jgi:hypothetical protein
LLRELTGSGYIGTAILVLLASLGLNRFPKKLFWIFCVAVPIALAFLADWLFGYFFAIRQVISVLTPLCLLAARAIEALSVKRPAWATGAGALLMIVLIAGNISFFRKPRENWQSAARILSSLPPDACIVFLPEDSLPLYTFFDRRLAGRKCPSSPADVSRVAVARSPYADPTGTAVSLPAGFEPGPVWNKRGPTVEIYSRR